MLLVLALAATLVQGAETPRARSDAQTVVRLEGESIIYQGLLTEAANEKAAELYDRSSRKPQAVHITSIGGSAIAGMQLGSWIAAHDLAVHVSTKCFSSCASYVFPAGRIKILEPTAILLWHGGATQPITEGELENLLDGVLAELSADERGELLRHRSRESLIHELKRSREYLMMQEREYFAMLGVDSRLATLGHLYQHELLEPDDHYVGWDYSLDDLARLGVRDAVVAGDRAWTPAREIEGGRIYRLELSSLSQFEPELAER